MKFQRPSRDLLAISQWGLPTPSDRRPVLGRAILKHISPFPSSLFSPFLAFYNETKSQYPINAIETQSQWGSLCPPGPWGCSYITDARAEANLTYSYWAWGDEDLLVHQPPAQRGFYKFIPLAFLPNAVRICYEIRPPTGETTSLSNPSDDFLRSRLDKKVTSPAPPG